jgi:small membrane protein
MILIQPILIAAIAAAAVVHFRSAGSRLLSRLVTMLFVTLAVVFIVNPEAANRLAHLVGVGRGADLVMYAFLPASISMFLHLYRRSRQHDDRLTRLVRHIAILEARRPA